MGQKVKQRTKSWRPVLTNLAACADSLELGSEQEIPDEDAVEN